ncbi:MAG TPA: hypothetical protein VFE56_03700, partial [Candidatus Binataceae bacterium]|nr:hypothetical protein [Candidatus Binataceae bacterium]
LLAGDGYPVGLGVISFDPSLIRTAHGVMVDVVAEGLPAPLPARGEDDWAGKLLDALQLPEKFGDPPAPQSMAPSA